MASKPTDYERGFWAGVLYSASLARAAADNIRPDSETGKFGRTQAGAMEALNSLAVELEGAPVEFEGVAATVKPAQTAASMAPVVASEKIAQAVALGFTGDECRDCGNFTLVRNGTCLKCETCGSTTGCS